ncbi:branched-chain amino acid ABC transporter permease [Bradyrhizobium tropiciagri]|uniref:branched-chain amino acid ABC transporter permease n=1 Tax=Bradyrhizobium tropiciagri TaxID=312253 RepID=UPI001BAA7A2E|nr:branched-chain amino acid ABC transporter permease [Bradyrhizobium tropiciagri]MBR0873315.1 branched-chain amino acid ABC transporter permease [Bradyrhizobium tropiciagri]
MNFEIAAFLVQDGVTVGAVYALLAVALVLVFTVTRIIFIPQGEFVSYGALTLVALNTGRTPNTIWLLVVLALCVWMREAWKLARSEFSWPVVNGMLRDLAMTSGVCAMGYVGASAQLPFAIKALISISIVVLIGTKVYRLVYEPLQSASILVLLIASVGVHLALTGIGLAMFGAEGSRTSPLVDIQANIGALTVTGQSVAIGVSALLAMLALSLFFGRTLEGKALKATAENRLGARLVGIRTVRAGRLALGVAAAIGSASGILLAPLSTIYYDTGFLIGLKGFIAAVIGGMVSYPVAAIGALMIGILESFITFETSALKDVIVFTLILPVLLYRSLSFRDAGQEQSN